MAQCTKKNVRERRSNRKNHPTECFPAAAVTVLAGVCGASVRCEGTTVFLRMQKTSGQTGGGPSCGKAYC